MKGLESEGSQPGRRAELGSGSVGQGEQTPVRVH